MRGSSRDSIKKNQYRATSLSNGKYFLNKKSLRIIWVYEKMSKLFFFLFSDDTSEGFSCLILKLSGWDHVEYRLYFFIHVLSIELHIVER